MKKALFSLFAVLIIMLFAGVMAEAEPTPCQYTPMVRKEIDTTYGPTVSNNTFVMDLELTKAVDANNNDISGSSSVHGDRTLTQYVTVEAGTAAKEEPFDLGIRFTQAGTYTFRITEQIPNALSDATMTYDSTVWTLTVVVKDKDGELVVVTRENAAEGEAVWTHYSAPRQPDNDKMAVFYNAYRPTPTDYTPPVKKRLATPLGVPVGERTFSFDLELVGATLPTEGGTPVADYTRYTSPLSSSTTVTLEGNQPENWEYFDKITYTRAGRYEYEITENPANATNPAGIEFSGETWTLTVVVEDMDGWLMVTGHTYAGDGGAAEANDTEAIFVNTYRPQPVQYAPEVCKSLVFDNGPTTSAKTFDFRISMTKHENFAGEVIPAETVTIGSTTAQAVVPVGSTKATTHFGDIAFTMGGVYEFRITEVRPALAEEGITYDTAVWTLTLHIYDRDGQLWCKTIQYTATGSASSTVHATFTNHYKGGGTPVPMAYYAPAVKKTIASAVGPTVAAKTFTFTLSATDNPGNGASIPIGGDAARVTIPAGESTGQGSFAEIVFTKAGTYAFAIRENEEDSPGMTYDRRTWALKVAVVKKSGSLQVSSVSYTCGSLTSKKAASFTNTYAPEPARVALEGKKIVSADVPAGNAVFAFELVAENDRYPMPAENRVEVDAADLVGGACDFAFGPIAFDQPGTYVYGIREIPSAVLGYTYDEHVCRVSVTVRHEDGALLATVRYETVEPATDAGVHGKGAVFVNRYGFGTLSVSNRVDGNAAFTTRAFVFHVELFDTEGHPLGVRARYSGSASGEIVNGVADIALKHGEAITIEGLPYGAAWRVTEPDSDVYAATCDTASGTIRYGEDAASNWVNERNAAPIGDIEFDLTLPKAARSVDDGTFSGVAARAVYIGDACARIGDRAFRNCGELRVIRIPARCAIGRDAFEGCSDLLIYGTLGSPAESYAATHDNCLFIEE